MFSHYEIHEIENFLASVPSSPKAPQGLPKGDGGLSLDLVIISHLTGTSGIFPCFWGQVHDKNCLGPFYTKTTKKEATLLGF